MNIHFYLLLIEGWNWSCDIQVTEVINASHKILISNFTLHWLVSVKNQTF